MSKRIPILLLFLIILSTSAYAFTELSSVTGNVFGVECFRDNFVCSFPSCDEEKCAVITFGVNQMWWFKDDFSMKNVTLLGDARYGLSCDVATTTPYCVATGYDATNTYFMTYGFYGGGAGGNWTNQFNQSVATHQFFGVEVYSFLLTLGDGVQGDIVYFNTTDFTNTYTWQLGDGLPVYKEELECWNISTTIDPVGTLKDCMVGGVGGDGGVRRLYTNGTSETFYNDTFRVNRLDCFDDATCLGLYDAGTSPPTVFKMYADNGTYENLTIPTNLTHERDICCNETKDCLVLFGDGLMRLYPNNTWANVTIDLNGTLNRCFFENDSWALIGGLGGYMLGGSVGNLTPPIICAPNWTCSGYADCVFPNNETSCNNVTDQNACGLNYTGNYSEFATQSCSYPSLITNASNMTCHFAANPYLKTALPFTDCDRIDWLCEGMLLHDCISYVEKDGDILQTNPNIRNTNLFQDGNVLNVISQSSFEPKGNSSRIVRVYFTTKDLYAGESYQFRVECNIENVSTSIAFFEATITPSYKPLDQPVNYGAWYAQGRAGYIVLIIFGSVLLIGAIIFIVRKLKGK